MPVSGLSPFPYKLASLTDSTPFSYRDGTTWLEKIAIIEEWLNKTLVPDVNDNIEKLLLDFQEGIANAEGTTTAAKAEWQAFFTDFMENVDANISILNDNLFIARKGRRGVTRTIYVRADGVDTNDGKTAGTAFREIKAAVASLDSEGGIIQGTVVIDVGPGTYKGGTRFPLTRGKVADDFIYVRGPAMDHPSVPTAIIDKAADTNATYGFMGEDGATVYFEDIKVVGAFDQAFTFRRFCYVWFKNIHIDGMKVGTNGGKVGLNIMHHCSYHVLGGRIENMVTNGVEELFNVTRSYDSATSEATAMYIRNCDTGFLAKEGCVGHLDWTVIEDCGTGIEFNGGCVTNVKAVTLKRNQVGLVNASSEVHNDGGIRWGTGADKNLRDTVTLGGATDLTLTGWAGSESARTMATGHRPLIQLASKYDDVIHTGTTVETQIISFVAALKAHRYNTAGKKFRVTMRGITNTTLAGTVRLMLRVGGQIATDVTLAAGTVSGSRFKAEFEVICTADGDNQIYLSELTGEGVISDYTDPRRNLSNADADKGVAISVIAANAADSITIKTCEVWG